VVIFGIFGDLFESYLKRLAGVKDSGVILGEQGGLLDRMDGYLFGVLAMYMVLV
jgi:phosphatidate cytidylyltransferase